LLRQAMQEVALVLARVLAAQQTIAPVYTIEARVMPGGDLRRAEADGVVEERSELDLGVAKDIGVRRPPGGVFAQELRKHALLVLGGKVHRLELDANHVGRGRGIDQVLARRAVFVGVVVLPVLHEEADHVIALALEQQRGYRRIDAARHADHDLHANSGDSSSSGKRRPARKSATHFATSGERWSSLRASSSAGVSQCRRTISLSSLRAGSASPATPVKQKRRKVTSLAA